MGRMPLHESPPDGEAITNMIRSRDEALELLHELSAPAHLVHHVKLVEEAGEQLLEQLQMLGVTVDSELVCMGLVLHDAGKVLHPLELTGPGSEHEMAGERMLLEHSVQPELARICRCHGQWDRTECTLEGLTVALADALWKGTRTDLLEGRFVERVAVSLKRDRWEVFLDLDACFERIAAGGDERLRSC